MKNHYNIRVYGKVQGVWFRDSTRRKAAELQVAGFVRNEPDGSVYIEAEGDEASLKKLAEWSQIGPERAEVSHVVVVTGEMKFFETFEIERF